MSPIRNLLWTTAFAFVLSGAANVSALGQERQFPEHNCAITPPAGWEELSGINQSGLVVAFGNEERSRLLMILVDTKTPATRIDDNFVSEFERGVEAGGGGKRISGKFVDVGGVQGYERLGSATINGNQTSILMRALPGEGMMYLVQAMRIDGDVNDAPEIRDAIQTFRFLTPPSPPSVAAPSAAYKTGYILGRLMCFGAFVLAAVAVVVVIVIAVRRKGPPPPPPPTISTPPQGPPPIS